MFGTLDQDRFVAGLLKRKVNQLVRQPNFQVHERDDLRQELLRHLVQRLPQFDARRGSWFRFVTAILERATATLVRDRKRHKRQVSGLTSLSEPLWTDQEFSEMADQLRDGEHAKRFGTAPRSQAEQKQLELDVAQVLSTVSPSLRRLAERLMVQPIAAAARELGLPRSTVQSRVHKLLQLFEKADLHEYLQFPSSSGGQSG